MSTYGPVAGGGPVEVHRAGDRSVTRSPGVDSWHSFAFGDHYDPANTRFGPLVAHNDITLAPGAGFPTHPHRELEIVTWVLDGELAHADSAGHSGRLRPGVAQRMTAGTGIEHAETNRSDRPVRFAQMWVVPAEPGLRPGYCQRDVNPALAGGALVPVVSGRPGDGAAVPIAQADARLLVARPRPGGSVVVAAGPYVHLFVARGAVGLADLTGETGPAAEIGLAAGGLAEIGLVAGDAARLTGAGERRVTAGPAGAEILVWELRSARA